MGKVTTERFIRKPLYVDAVRITQKNFNDIAEWCQGEVMRDEAPTDSGAGKFYIKIRVHNPKNPRQTKAFVGDWLLYTERGYKVYTNKAFHSSFDLVEEDEQTNPEQERLESIDEQVRNETGIIGAGAIKEVDGQPVGTVHEHTRAPGDLAKAQVKVDPSNIEPTYDVEADVRQQMDAGLKEQIFEPGVSYQDGDKIRLPDGREVTVHEYQAPDVADAVAEKVHLHSVGPVTGTPGPGTGIGEIQEVSAPYNPDPVPPPSTVPPVKPVVVQRDPDLKTVEDVPEQEKVVPAAIEGKRVLSVAEQERMGTDEVRELIQAGEVVLAQDIAQP